MYSAHKVVVSRDVGFFFQKNKKIKKEKKMTTLQKIPMLYKEQISLYMILLS